MGELKLEIVQESGGCGSGHGGCGCGSGHGEQGGCGGHDEGQNAEYIPPENQILAADPKASTVSFVLCTIPQDVGMDRTSGPFPVMPKVAICSIFNHAKKAGYTGGDFYDTDNVFPTDEEMFNYFKEKQPSVAGISAVVSTSYYQAKRIAGIIHRASPSTWIVLGGYMAASSNVILRKTEVDLCFLGDGEKTFIEFLNYVKNHGEKRNYKELEKIKGIAFLNGNDDLITTGYGEASTKNEFYFPDYDILALGLRDKSDLVEKYYFRDGVNSPWFNHDSRAYDQTQRPKLAIFWSTKGCVARCTFCQRFSGEYNPSDLDSMDQHLAMLKEKYNVGFIALGDENFGSDKKHAYEVAKLMKKHGMLWICGGIRCTSLKAEDLKFMRDNNCAALKFGVESGSQKILNSMEKRFTVENVRTALKNAEDAGLYSPLGFCIGMPGETTQTILETGNFMGEIARMQGVPPCDLDVGLFYALPLPGTPLYEFGQLNGVIGATPDEEEKYLHYMSDKGTSKDNYVNLTGQPLKEVVFWDFLAAYEAMRTYYSKPLDSPDPTNTLKHNTNVPYPLHTAGSLRRPSPVLRAIANMTGERFYHYITNPITYLNKILIRKKFVTKIPRPIFYGIMKNLTYLEYMARTMFGAIQPFSRKQVPAVAESESLRVVCARLNQQLPPPQTVTEKNRKALLLGA